MEGAGREREKVGIAEIAKAEMLDQATLNRCVKFVKRRPVSDDAWNDRGEQEVVRGGVDAKQVRAMISQKGKLDRNRIAQRSVLRR